MIRVAFLVMVTLACFSSGFDDGGGTIPQAKRIMVLGDSLTRGLYASSETKSFASIVAHELGADLARLPGTHLAGVESLWSQSKHWKPDVVIIEVGLNDVAGHPTAPTEDGWPERYAALVGDIQSTGATVITCTMYKAIRSGGPLDDKYDRYNGYIRDSGGIVADLWEASRGCTDCRSDPGVASPYPPHWAGDDFHPNDKGHSIIAQTILEVFSHKAYMPLLYKYHGNN